MCNFTILVPPEWIEERYGSYTKLLNVNAWILHFAFNLKSNYTARACASRGYVIGSGVHIILLCIG